MIKPITLFQHFPWNVHLIRNDHRKLKLSLTIDWNMIVCSRTTAIVASEMCIEYRTIYNSIGRVWEIPDTGITDCQAVDIRSHPVYHLSTCRIRSTYMWIILLRQIFWASLGCQSAHCSLPRCHKCCSWVATHLMCSLTSLQFTHWHSLTPAHQCLRLYQRQTWDFLSESL